jgi:hypothetical protein
VSGERCSELSRAAGESLAATATSARRWLLVEVRGGWPREVSDPGALPETASAAVSDWLARTPGSRLLFVRRPGRVEGPSLAFVVDADERHGRVRRLELGVLDDLGEIDLDTDGGEVGAGIVLVCGHGGRDPCCALRGTAVFGALAPALGDEQLWISSHQGGHRFAANVLVLPAGLHFGRVEPGESLSLVTRALSGAIERGRYRGRTCYPPIAQAAERVLRETMGLEEVAALELVDVDGPDVLFRDRSGAEHRAVVEEHAGPIVPASCGAEPEPQRTFVATLR